MNRIIAGAVIVAATVIAAPSGAATVAGQLNAQGTADYRFTSAGGNFTVSVASAGANPVHDPSVYIFKDNGSTLSAKTGEFVAYNDDYFSLSSFISVNLAAGNYIMSVGRYYFSEAEARSGMADYGANQTFNLTTSQAVSAAGVPEPATWALMILGFGAVGGAMRRRAAGAAVRFA